MKEFKNMLLPIDFSEVSIVLVPYAKYFAKHFQLQVHLLYVVRSLDYFGGFYVPHTSIKKFEEEILKGAEKRMKDFIEEHFKDLQVIPHVLIGDAATEILNFAEEKDIDLILMGTHGRKGLDKIIFGSVAERVVKGASCPVLTINPYRAKLLKEE